ncbi:MAG TPA: NAD(P)(+) transhydrogenase (Re/Si-specific) subunit beta [Phycisphaerae bacterium]|nr:NAD(P)(+) transhydrogenase (Re/Si-specific) subunit beta [Phycisphaerae bacterium]HNU47097.1 NAD(P)(+) transhydrogenase (Re/Si-specific) subunit beta [Phycisphaerae bacterium]
MLTGLLVDLAVIVVLLAGIAQFRTPPGARRGNWTAALALAGALAVVLYRHRLQDVPLVVVVSALGVLIGAWVAVRVTMIQIPAMVAFQHGAGGVAAFLVAYVELTRSGREPLTAAAEIAALLGLIVGAGTFSGSLVASGKLANRLRQTPTVLPGHNAILVALAVVLGALGIWAAFLGAGISLCVVLTILIVGSAALGIVFAVRIGGADMPVLISFLNATAGLAAALCGVAIGNRLLIACGATVAASGSILTHVMCRGMNRGLASVFTGIKARPAAAPMAPSSIRPDPAADVAEAVSPAGDADPISRSVELLREARRVIVIPGYGMALADAQEEVVRLGERLVELGKEVKFAVHPVAGRMPGHMHVLLAEAEVDYGRLYELKDINHEFAETDIAIIVGACDVVNPAATERSDTPISGMPILKAHEARHVVVCNLDERPGYSGVANPLYGYAKTVLVWGDAQETIGRIRAGLS